MKIQDFIKDKDLLPWLENIREKYRVFLPVQDSEEARIDFMDYDDYIELGKDEGGKRYSVNLSEKTKLSPKMSFFPLTEKLFDFKYIKNTEDPENITTDVKVSVPDRQDLPVFLFGAKPCDTAGLKRLDIFYCEDQKKDIYYLNRRRDSIVLAIGCTDPFPDCFCTSVDGHPFDFENADIGLVGMEGGYAVIKVGEKVKKFMADSKKYISSPPAGKGLDEKADSLSKEAEKKLKQYWKDIDKKRLSKIMDNSMDEGLWQDITAKCISCGACTYVCPTCFCFNIRDEQKGLEGERYRCWDYCMNSYYTLEASGHNPRADKNKRYRNKVNCKYNYNIKRSNNYYCIGCGRCIEVCPVSVDIRAVVDTVIKNDSKAPVK